MSHGRLRTRPKARRRIVRDNASSAKSRTVAAKGDLTAALCGRNRRRPCNTRRQAKSATVGGYWPAARPKTQRFAVAKFTASPATEPAATAASGSQPAGGAAATIAA